MGDSLPCTLHVFICNLWAERESVCQMEETAPRLKTYLSDEMGGGSLSEREEVSDPPDVFLQTHFQHVVGRVIFYYYFLIHNQINHRSKILLP